MQDVTLKALIKRINRQLAHESQRLKITRGGQARANLGDYYVLDLHRNVVVDYRFNLEEVPREIHGRQARVLPRLVAGRRSTEATRERLAMSALGSASRRSSPAPTRKWP